MFETTIHPMTEPTNELGNALVELAATLAPGDTAYVEIHSAGRRRAIVIKRPEDGPARIMGSDPAIRANCIECGDLADLSGLQHGLCTSCRYELGLVDKSTDDEPDPLADACIECGGTIEVDGNEFCFGCFAAHEGRER